MFCNEVLTTEISKQFLKNRIELKIKYQLQHFSVNIELYNIFFLLSKIPITSLRSWIHKLYWMNQKSSTKTHFTKSSTVSERIRQFVFCKIPKTRTNYCLLLPTLTGVNVIVTKGKTTQDVITFCTEKFSSVWRWISFWNNGSSHF